MRIITSYPIIKNGKVVANNCYNTTLDYSSVTGTNPLPKFSDSNVFSKPFVAPINVVKPDIGKASGGASSTKTGRNIDFESLGDKASAGIKVLAIYWVYLKNQKEVLPPNQHQHQLCQKIKA